MSRKQAIDRRLRHLAADDLLVCPMDAANGELPAAMQIVQPRQQKVALVVDRQEKSTPSTACLVDGACCFAESKLAPQSAQSVLAQPENRGRGFKTGARQRRNQYCLQLAKLDQRFGARNRSQCSADIASIPRSRYHQLLLRKCAGREHPAGFLIATQSKWHASCVGVPGAQPGNRAAHIS